MARCFQQPVHNGLSEAFRGKSLGIDLCHTFIIEFSQNGVQMSGDTALILTQGDGMPALTNAEEFLNSVNVTPGGSAGLVVADGKPFALGPYGCRHFSPHLLYNRTAFLRFR